MLRCAVVYARHDRSRALLGRGGSLIVFGLSSAANRGPRAALTTLGTLLSLALFQLLPGKRSSVFAIDKIYRTEPARVRGWVARALELLAAGTITPLIGATLPLAETEEAHRLLESGKVDGKIVLDCR